MSVLRSSLIMATGTVLSRVLGIVRAILLAAMIGVTTNAADAFGVANQLPNNVYAIIVGGVLNAVLVPQIVRARSHADGGKGYVDRLLTMAISVFAIITVLTTLAAPLLVSVYTTGWSSSQLALATAFAYGLYTLLGEVLNANSRFGPYMWAPVLNNVVAIVGMAIFVWQFGFDPTGKQSIETWGAGQITLLAGTATAGVAAQALILFAFWRKAGLSFTPNFHWRGTGLRPAMRTASWTLGMLVITQIGGVVQTAVASKAVEGRDGSIAIASVAAMSIAWLIFMLPHSVATVSIATAYFTKMSTHAVEGKIGELKNDLVAGLRTIALISVLATTALIVLAYPISRVFIGELPSAIALGNVVIAMVVGLLPFSYVFMIQRAFYALEDTRTPFIFTVVQTAINIIGAIVIANVTPHQYIVVALSLLGSGAIVVQCLLAYVLFKRKHGSLGHSTLFTVIWRFAVAAIISGGIGFGLLQALGGANPGRFPVATIASSGITCLALGFAMAMIYLALLRVLRVPEATSLVSNLTGAIRRIAKRK